jgi:DNA-binding transcriptional ArsR family regulator
MPVYDSLKTPSKDPTKPDYRQLSLYLDALGSDVRLQIIKHIENKAKDIKSISRKIETSPENAKKHLNKLLSLGLVRYGDLRQNVKGQPVKTYILAPGSYEIIMRTLGHFCTMQFGLTDTIKIPGSDLVRESIADGPYIKLIGGIDDGKIFSFSLKQNHEIIRLGRMDPDLNNREKIIPDRDIIVENSYCHVMKISHPHARISCDHGRFFLEDCESVQGTYLNGQRLVQFRKNQLQDNDFIELGNGTHGARFIFFIPQKEERVTSG